MSPKPLLLSAHSVLELRGAAGDRGENEPTSVTMVEMSTTLVEVLTTTLAGDAGTTTIDAVGASTTTVVQADGGISTRIATADVVGSEIATTSFATASAVGGTTTDG
eukprot:CAMPEP_0115728982 /NCGR_PEP_ID=MMETSP0272-20121206/83263_1 /TAXON_ID=71861 /ORGANISM="Scrippsiella trochoidea, Strain CCMP3099" /LENGTH=106 /DNA_ID=CAMNT_0003172631 /DNA_START=1 /DNA_END=317 /DNA_ORIENTATION=+